MVLRDATCQLHAHVVGKRRWTDWAVLTRLPNVSALDWLASTSRSRRDATVHLQAELETLLLHQQYYHGLKYTTHGHDKGY
jgi:hypothetical protein